MVIGVSPQHRPPVATVVPQVGSVLMSSAEGADDRRRGQIVFEDHPLHFVHVLAALRGLLLPFRLVASVLEPDFHLGLGQSQCAGQLSPLGGRQVLVVVELLLQLQHLEVRERSPGALLLPRRRQTAAGL